jgi:hypothetical protein
MSPIATPNAKGTADLKPPDTDRAITATQTGPGVLNKMKSAPAYSASWVSVIVI